MFILKNLLSTRRRADVEPLSLVVEQNKKGPKKLNLFSRWLDVSDMLRLVDWFVVCLFVNRRRHCFARLLTFVGYTTDKDGFIVRQSYLCFCKSISKRRTSTFSKYNGTLSSRLLYWSNSIISTIITHHLSLISLTHLYLCYQFN